MLSYYNMSKNIHLSFSNGAVYRFPAKIIAEHRANYYASKFEGEEGTYEEIFDDEMWVLDDKLELIDWMRGHMNWDDVKDDAELHTITGINKSEEFMNADFEIVED